MSEAENPLLEGLRLRRSPDACAIVIFGASGDLTRRKIFPALYSLAFRRLLPERFGIVGVARTEQTTKQWAAEMKKAVKEHGRDELRTDVWNELERFVDSLPAGLFSLAAYERFLAEFMERRAIHPECGLAGAIAGAE